MNQKPRSRRNNKVKSLAVARLSDSNVYNSKHSAIQQ